jgi:hypothetical protein
MMNEMLLSSFALLYRYEIAAALSVLSGRSGDGSSHFAFVKIVLKNGFV